MSSKFAAYRPVPSAMDNLLSLVNSPLLLVRAVIANYLVMVEPGAEDVITFPGPRAALVQNVAECYRKITGIATYKFPYSEAAVIDMHTKFRKLTEERKQQVLDYLGLTKKEACDLFTKSAT